VRQPRIQAQAQKIFDCITGILQEHAPDDMALEAPFLGKNVQSMGYWQWRCLARTGGQNAGDAAKYPRSQKYLMLQ
jgi:Holliday junction resolvasome RuvABC endonuclease subunit